jgi:uncharacterized protein YfdQ (DUF2303 family)
MIEQALEWLKKATSKSYVGSIKHLEDNCGPFPFILGDKEMTLHSLAHLLPFPDRKRVVVDVTEIPSFVQYVNEQKVDATRIFGRAGADGHLQAPALFVAIIDYHGIGEEADDASWLTHTAVLTLTTTPEWKHWIASNGKAFAQEEFALFLEDHLPDIAAPDGATILEIASSIEASKDMSFRSAIRLEDGTRRFKCDEEMAAKAGVSRDLEIPDRFRLNIPVFDGCDGEFLDARFRYNIRDGALRLSYKLIRPDALLDAAVKSARLQIREQTQLPVFMGKVTPLEAPGIKQEATMGEDTLADARRR